MSIKLKLFLFVLLPVFAIFVLIKLYDFELARVRSETEIQAGLIQEAQNHANRVDSLLSQAGAIALTTARFLSATDIGEAEVIYEVLRRNVEGNPFVYGSAVAFEPFVFEGRALFSPYVHRSGSGFESIDIGTESYDYTQPEWEWYTRPRELARPVWTEPYFDDGAGGIFMVTLSAPFFSENTFAGVATVDLDLRKLLELSGIDAVAQANAFVLSSAGNLVFHPDVSRLGMPLNDSAFPGTLRDGASGFVEVPGAAGEARWLAHAPIPTSDWDFVVGRNRSSALAGVFSQERRVILLFAGAMFAGVVIAMVFVSRIVNPVTRHLEITVAERTAEVIAERERLKVSEERLEGAAAGAKLGLWDVLPQTGEIFVNEIFESQLGYPPLSLRETDTKWSRLRFGLGDWPGMIHPDDRQRVIDTIGWHLRGETPVYRSEHRVRRADGSYEWILSTGMPTARDSAGLPTRVAGVHIDIGPMKELQSQLEFARDAAEAAGQAKADFLANMSHEIRTPMNAIIGLGNLILKTNLTPKQRDSLEKIQSSSRSLLGIINDILDFSKVEAGKLEIEAILFDLDEVLDGVSDLVTLQAAKKGLEILFAVEKDVPHRLIGDPLRIGQILSNLCSNAVKFTEKGEIRIAVRILDRAARTVRLQFSVSDTGIGLKEEHRGKIFQAFSQADTSTTRRYGGTGLGLPICKRLVELMGGTIGVESEPGKGSTFTFTVSLEKAPEADQPDRSVLLELQGLRALVVDDNESARSVLAEALRAFTFDVNQADSGMAALEALQRAAADSFPYALVLMDWHMPGIDGIEAIQRIRHDDRLRDTPHILLVAASGSDEVIERAEKAGIGNVLVKPVSRSALFDTVMEVLGGRLASKAESPEAVLHNSDSTLDSSTRILVVEDHPINQEVLLGYLEELGLSADVASNGREALNMHAGHSYDVILSDVHMPEMDGIEMVSELRRRERDSSGRAFVIAVSASARPEELEHNLRMGFDDCIQKPIDPDVLEKLLRRIIGRARTASDTF